MSGTMYIYSPTYLHGMDTGNLAFAFFTVVSRHCFPNKGWETYYYWLPIADQ
jgi:hypothetical protein